MTAASAPYDAILTPLDRVIARRRVRTILRIFIASAIVATGAFLALLVAERLGAAPVRPLPIIIAVVVATMLGAALFARLRERSSIKEAFWVDRTTGLNEIYGTAVELAHTAAPISSPVVAGLFAKVEDELGQISATRLVRIVTPGLLLAILALVALGAATAFVQQMPPPVRTTPAIEYAASPTVDLEALKTVTEMLAKDAELRDDALLDAIARTLAEAVAESSTGPLSPELEKTINDLLEQAASVYGEAAPSWLGSSADARLFELGDAVASMDPLDAPGARPELELAIDPYARRPDQPTPFSASNPFDKASELAGLSAGEDGADSPGAANEVSSNLQGAASEQGPELMPEEALRAIGATPLGAALDSGRGISHAAGLGQEDFQADDDFARLGFQPTEDMVLSAEPQVQGGRIRIEIIPDTASANVSDAVSGVGVQAASGSTHTVDREFIPAQARVLSARYFERTAQ